MVKNTAALADVETVVVNLLWDELTHGPIYLHTCPCGPMTGAGLFN